MRIRDRRLTIAAAVMAAGAAMYAQGRGGQNWNTFSADAQRTGWLRTETRISVATLQEPKAGGFQLLWKVKPENEPRQLVTLTQPIILGNLISHKGFKALAFVGGSSDLVYAYDYDLAKVYWSQRLSTGTSQKGTVSCANALTAITRATPLNQSAIPERGAPPAPGGGGRGPQTGINPANLPITNAVWVISSGGMVHALNPHIGADLRPPVRIVPAGAKVLGSVLVDDVLYAATAEGCGGAPNGVWALDVSGKNASATSKMWTSGGPSIVGSAGPTLGLNGVIYIATGAGSGSYANAVVGLDRNTLQPTGWFAGDAPFTTTPTAFNVGGRDVVAAAARDGRVYVLDGKTPGGSDHHTALARSAASVAGEGSSGVTTWQDSEGTRWLLVTSPTSIVTFRLAERDGTFTLEQGWTSRELTTPMTPIVLNDVAFGLSTGAVRGAAAVLYAFDAKSGKELWNSGAAIRTSAQGVGPSGQDGQVYIVGADGTLYAFGIPLEH
jgi:PQQ-like domain